MLINCGKVVKMAQVGKLGAKPRDFSVKAPVFESYITDVRALPDAPNVVDRASEVTDWPMYLNDTLGDCTIAGALHSATSLATYAGMSGVSFEDAEALKAYSAVGGYVPGDPNTDQGCTLQAVCDYWQKTGFADKTGRVHKLAAYAEIGDPTNLALIKQALYVFGTVYMAFNLPESAQQQFAADKIFSYVPGSPIDGGHCMVLQLSAVGDLARDNTEYLITWAKAQPATTGFMQHTVSEAIAVVSPDVIDAQGVNVAGFNLSQLLQDCKAL